LPNFNLVQACSSVFLRYQAVFGETAEKNFMESEKIDDTKLEPEKSLHLNMHADKEQNICRYRDHDHVSQLIFVLLFLDRDDVIHIEHLNFFYIHPGGENVKQQHQQQQQSL
jgi:hypothetical protein